jgi:DNA-binding transcriptional ArsR family regulator
MRGEADISVPAGLLANSGRARVLLALADGRALPASVLASEAGVAASTTSEHLTKLTDAGMLCVERQGRHRYYRIASPKVMHVVEALAQIAPTAPIRSLREHTRAHALRRGRLCYDHLAGRLGTALMGALIERGAISGGDGIHHPDRARRDRLAAAGHDIDYRLTDDGAELLSSLGVDTAELAAGRRPLIRYCLDWSEQRHHLAGALGAAIASSMFERDWLSRRPEPRAVQLTDHGRRALRETLGLRLDG